MKTLHLLTCLLLTLLLFSSCDLFKPDDDDDPVEAPDSILGSKVIGPAGGELDLDSIQVIVPDNAFNEENEISVSLAEDNISFSGYGLSAMYQLTGLPNKTNEPIRLKIKYHGAIEGDTLVAIGEPVFFTGADTVITSFTTDHAADSSGYLIYDLPANPALKMPDEHAGMLFPDSVMYFIALGGYNRQLSSAGHFMLSYPVAYSAQGVLMGEHFEEAYDTCEAMEFDLTERDWVGNPASVLAKPSSDYNGAYAYRISKVRYDPNVTDQEIRFYFNVGRFLIDLDLLNNDPKLRAVCGHEFLHLVQNLYEFSSPNVENEQKWLKEATSVWIMEKFSDLPYYVPHSMDGREMYPFHGWQYAGRSHARHGYGLSVIFKDIVEQYGQQAIRTLYENVEARSLPSNALDPVDAVFSVLTEPVGQFWHGLLGAYVLGHYYNDQVNFRFLDDWTNFTTFTVDPTNNVIPVTLDYHDLSGKLFKIIPGDLSTLTTVPVSFTVDDPVNCGILVCKYKQGSEITSIGEVFPGESGNVFITDVKPLFDAGYELVVMVSNSTYDTAKNYQGNNNVELMIEMVGGDAVSGSVEFYIDDAEFQRSDDPTPFTGTLNEVVHLQNVSGTLTGNTYSGNYWFESLGRTYSGTVRFVFYDNPSSINLYLHNTMSYHSLWGYGTVTQEYTVHCNGIPWDGVNPASGANEYSKSGGSVCGMSLNWEETNDLYDKEVNSYNCGPAAYIQVSVDTL